MSARQQVDQLIRQRRLAVLQNGTDEQKQLAAVIAAAETAANEYASARQSAVDSGRFTDEGLKVELAPMAKRARDAMEAVYARVVQPRVEAATTALKALPAVTPQPAELTELERDRLVKAWQVMDREQRLRTLAHAHEEPRLVAALLAEDKLVVGLDTVTRARLLRIATPKDEHANKRFALQQTLDDAAVVREQLQSIADTTLGDAP